MVDEANMETKTYSTLRLVFALIGYTLLINFGLSFIAGIIYASDWFQVIAAAEPAEFTTPKLRFQFMILAVNIINWFSATPAIFASAVAYWKLSDWTAKGNRQIFWIIVGAPLAGFLIFRFYRAFYLNEFSVFDIRFTYTLHTIIPNILITLFIIWFSARKFDQYGNKKEYSE